jgi:hypothetical protein
MPIDLILPEAFSFLMLFGWPHLALGRALLLLALLAYLDGRGVWAGLALLGVGLAQPLYMVVGWAVMGAHAAAVWMWERRRRDGGAEHSRDWRTASVAMVLSAPFVVYNALVLRFDPVLAQWMAQNTLPSPHPLHYGLAFGLLLAPAAAGWRSLWERDTRLALMAGVWLPLAFVMAYAPVPAQRRLVEAVQLPLAALAVVGLQSMAAHWRRPAAVTLLILSLPTTLLLFLGALVTGSRIAEPVFHPPDQLAVFAWLRQHAAPGEAALSAYATGNALPAYSPISAFVGHGPETIGLGDKLTQVARFYAERTSDADRRRLLEEGGIDYVIFGPHEARLGSFDPRTATYLGWRFEAGDYAIYAVAP